MLQYGVKVDQTMGINLSIKNVAAEKVEILRQRAKSNHRSLQGELLAIIDDVTSDNCKPTMSIAELSAAVRLLGLSRRREAVRMIREDRDR